LGTRAKQVAHEVHPAALPGGAHQHRGDRALQALVGVGDHQLDAPQPARSQAAQEGRPKGSVLGVADGQPQHLAVAVGPHPGGDHHRLAHHLWPLVGLEVGRVQEQVREGLWDRPAGELGHLLVELGADAADLGLGDARVDPQRPHQVVHLPGAHPVHVGLHDDGPQRPVDPPARLQQRGKEAAGAQLGDPQAEVARLGGEDPLADPVAVGDPLGAALVRLGADRLGGLQLDQGLQHQLQARADQVHVAAGAQCVEQLREGMLVEGHRVSFVRDLPGHAEDHPVAYSAATAPRNPTTRRDVGIRPRR
jgi:hypothetical protein